MRALPARRLGTSDHQLSDRVEYSTTISIRHRSCGTILTGSGHCRPPGADWLNAWGYGHIISPRRVTARCLDLAAALSHVVQVT